MFEKLYIEPHQITASITFVACRYFPLATVAARSARPFIRNESSSPARRDIERVYKYLLGNEFKIVSDAQGCADIMQQ